MAHVVIDPRPEIARRVRASSVTTVARLLGLQREQVARLAGGLPVRASTLALARERLEAHRARVVAEDSHQEAPSR